jgi:hypothetical protein
MKLQYDLFTKGHPELSLRQPQSSLARGRCFNKLRVLEYFDILEGMIGQNKLDATRVFNVV